MENHPFTPGQDWVLYARAVYGEREISAVLNCLNKDWLGVGEYTRRFESEVARIFGHSYGLFVNSGSSANLMALKVLKLPKGGEVVTPACTFSTTVNPIIQLGLVPVFVDVNIDTYNIDPGLVEAAITPKTVALMIPHLIGNINDLRHLRYIANKHSLKLIEDSCDTIGGSFMGNPTGSYADISTTSFYASHIITAMGGGGMLMSRDESLTSTAQKLRDWGRASAEYYDENPDIRFNFFLGDVQYDSKFVFRDLGYNLKAIDPQAAFGLVQLERLEEFKSVRKRNFKILYDFFARYPDLFILPRQVADADVNWLAFPLTIRDGAPIKRIHFMRHLEEHKIQTRVLFSGNILRHPAYHTIPERRIFGDLTNSDKILENSLLIGCHHGLRDDHLDYVKTIVDNYLRSV